MKGKQQNQQRRHRHKNRNQNFAQRSLDSHGPDVKVRGTATHIYKKYQLLARDAQLAGNRIKAENYLQHADHYYRIVVAAQNQLQSQSQGQNYQNRGQNKNQQGPQQDMRQKRQLDQVSGALVNEATGSSPLGGDVVSEGKSD